VFIIISYSILVIIKIYTFYPLILNYYIPTISKIRY